MKKSILITLMALLGLTSMNGQVASTSKELVELRTYEVKTGANMNVLVDYLKEVLTPTLKSKGASEVALFNEYGNSEPRKLYLMVAYPNSEAFIKSQELHKDMAYDQAAASYNRIGIENTLYNRITSMPMRL